MTQLVSLIEIILALRDVWAFVLCPRGTACPCSLLRSHQIEAASSEVIKVRTEIHANDVQENCPRRVTLAVRPRTCTI